jgi:hypothetical protein
VANFQDCSQRPMDYLRLWCKNRALPQPGLGRRMALYRARPQWRWHPVSPSVGRRHRVVRPEGHRRRGAPPSLVTVRAVVLVEERQLDPDTRFGVVAVGPRLEQVVARHAVMVGDDLPVLLRAEELLLQEHALGPAVVASRSMRRTWMRSMWAAAF